jgi:lipopolysaccharide export LptBFGC system permease protein LptF
VEQIVYTPEGGVGETKNFEQVDTDLTTPPRQISLVVSQPEQLTMDQLSQYIATSTSTRENLAKFRTEWWNRIVSPLSLIVLMFYGLLQGARIDRRDAAAGVFKTILLWILYVVVSNLVLQMGIHDKLSPFVAAMASPVAFGIVGIAVLAGKYGWWWQLLAFVKQWRSGAALKGEPVKS